ncbi:unnamed protein product [Nippostrongylus brasiliensis]|uniref:Conotoxin n=1 Tax=Nippostrongylus brasiliensis TaxID=27835 RepID=A0A0N4XZB0_NIPBR|nr:hypothetical protein Q1695_013999 [Nippostrongylus brasiliensis]VDL72088.1 unnamed protein product [Nippostrongylus brasiliensis]
MEMWRPGAWVLIVQLLLLVLSIMVNNSEATPMVPESRMLQFFKGSDEFSRFRRMDCCRYNQVLNCCTLQWYWNEE